MKQQVTKEGVQQNSQKLFALFHQHGGVENFLKYTRENNPTHQYH